MFSSSPHILGLGETVMDQAAVDILTTEGFNVERKDDNERISVLVPKIQGEKKARSICQSGMAGVQIPEAQS